MPRARQRHAPSRPSNLTVESPSAPNTISIGRLPARGAPAAERPPMQPISASTYEHTAARSRRKWGERGRGESMVAFETLWIGGGRPNRTCPNLQRLRLGKARLPGETVAPNPQLRSILHIAPKFL
jgi:hypothetical protein